MKLTSINPHFNACNQKWELMPEQEGGRRCHECERVLIDFTPLSEQEMLNQQRANDFKLCGRYTHQQVDRLHRHLALEESQSRRPWLVSLVMGASSLLPLSAAAQNTTITQEEIESLPKRDIVPIINVEPDFIMEEMVLEHDSIQIPIAHTVPLPGVQGELRFPLLDVQPADTVSQTIEGIVTDKETGESIPFAAVFIESLNIGAMTDFEGHFNLKLPPNSKQQYVLTANSVGYQKLEVPIDLTSVNSIKLDLLEMKLDVHVMGIVVSYAPTPMQRVKNAVNPAQWYRKIKYRLAR